MPPTALQNILVGLTITGVVGTIGILVKVTVLETLLRADGTGVIPQLAKLRADFDELRQFVHGALGSGE